MLEVQTSNLHAIASHSEMNSRNRTQERVKKREQSGIPDGEAGFIEKLPLANKAKRRVTGVCVSYPPECFWCARAS
jgi:hypothetical protein